MIIVETSGWLTIILLFCFCARNKGDRTLRRVNDPNHPFLASDPGRMNFCSTSIETKRSEGWKIIIGNSRQQQQPIAAISLVFHFHFLFFLFRGKIWKSWTESSSCNKERFYLRSCKLRALCRGLKINTMETGCRLFSILSSSFVFPTMVSSSICCLDFPA